MAWRIVSAPDSNRPDPATLLPHRGPARLLERLLEVGESRAIGLGRVPADSPFAVEGRVAAFVAVEMAAQVAAAWETLGRAGDDGRPEPRVGYVVSARDVELDPDGFPVGQSLRVTVELSGAAPPLTVYRFEVGHDDRRVAAGAISTYITDERG